MAFSFDRPVGEASIPAACLGESQRSWKINWGRLLGVVCATLISGGLWWVILGTFR